MFSPNFPLLVKKLPTGELGSDGERKLLLKKGSYVEWLPS
jgi:hypothetical protein